MTRVALVLGTSTGGVGRHVHELVRSLTSTDVQVTVAAPAEVEDRFGFEAAGATVLTLPLRDRPHPRGDATVIAALRALSARVDLVHAHGLRAGALAALARPRGGPPLVVTLHNAPPESPALAAVFTALEYIVARRVELVLTVSADLAERLRRRGARRVEPAVVAAPSARRASRGRAQVRGELGVPDDAAMLLTVGRLAPQKRPGDFVALVDAVRGTHPVVGVIAGDGPMRSELSEAAQDDAGLRLLGHRDDVPDLLAAADIVVSTAAWEGQPVSLQEALQQGCVIVATDTGGTAAVLGHAGLLFAVGDVVTGARHVTALLSDASLYAAQQLAAVTRAESLPTPQDAAQAALTAYRSVGVETP